MIRAEDASAHRNPLICELFTDRISASSVLESAKIMINRSDLVLMRAVCIGQDPERGLIQARAGGEASGIFVENSAPVEQPPAFDRIFGVDFVHDLERGRKRGIRLAVTAENSVQIRETAIKIDMQRLRRSSAQPAN